MIYNIHTQSSVHSLTGSLGLQTKILIIQNCLLGSSSGHSHLKLCGEQTPTPFHFSATLEEQAQVPSSPRGQRKGQKGGGTLSGLPLPHKRKGLSAFLLERKIKTHF